jgi:predicted small lipoprotein YifL
VNDRYTANNPDWTRSTMTLRTRIAVALVVLASVLVAACGNKGPLVRPGAPAAADSSSR